MLLKFLVFLTIYLVLSNVDCNPTNGKFPIADKSTQRMVKRSNKNNSNDDFEKFFLKASKSVPRIGRGGPPPVKYVPDNLVGSNDPFPYTHTQRQVEDYQKPRYPLWSEIAERFEYDPQLLTSPALLSQLEQAMGDDPSIYDWDKVRLERETS